MATQHMQDATLNIPCASLQEIHAINSENDGRNSHDSTPICSGDKDKIDALLDIIQDLRHENRMLRSHTISNSLEDMLRSELKKYKENLDAVIEENNILKKKIREDTNKCSQKSGQISSRLKKAKVATKERSLNGTDNKKISESRINSVDSADTNTDSRKKKCSYCGDFHKRGHQFCPWYGKACSCCGRLNHKAKMCKIGYGIIVGFLHGMENTMILVDQHSWKGFQMKQEYSMEPEYVLKCLRTFSKYAGPAKIPVIFKHKNKHTKSYCEELIDEIHKLTNEYSFEIRQASKLRFSHGVQENIINEYYQQKYPNQENIIREYFQRKYPEIQSEEFERIATKENKNDDSMRKDELLNIQIDNLTEKEYTKAEETCIDFANAILPKSTCQVTDLKSGIVWLHLVNRICHWNYKASKKHRKNYTNCIKMLQANQMDAEFMLENLEDALAGEKKAIMEIAHILRDIINVGDDWDICEEIESRISNISKERLLKKKKGRL